jgi:hypothetical protein
MMTDEIKIESNWPLVPLMEFAYQASKFLSSAEISFLPVETEK